jgi:hypothetical protein
MPCACGLALKRQALAEGVRLYPGIIAALQPWAEKLGVAPPAPLG